MKVAEAIEDLDEDSPDLLFREEFLFGFLLDYFLVEVSVIKKLHNNAEVKKSVPEIFALEEYLFVGDNAIIFDGG